MTESPTEQSSPTPSPAEQAATVQAATVQAATVQAATVQAATVQAATVQPSAVRPSGPSPARATAGSPRNPWRTLDTRVVYANSWITVREDSVIRPDGQPGIYGVVEIPASVGVVAVTERQEIALVSQWRYTLGKMSLEIPTGGSEAGETILQAAGRELAEEAGLTAATWIPLGSIDNSNGITTDVSHIFLARGLAPLPGGQRRQGDEEIEVVWMPFGRAVEAALAGDVTESVSVAGILRAALRHPELRPVAGP